MVPQGDEPAIIIMNLRYLAGWMATALNQFLILGLAAQKSLNQIHTGALSYLLFALVVTLIICQACALFDLGR